MPFDIHIAYATPQRQVEIPLTVEEGCTVAMAIHQSGIVNQFPDIDLSAAAVGIFSQKVTLDHILAAGDRLEIYRPLQMDPKEARLKRVASN